MTSHKAMSPLSASWPHLGLFPGHVKDPGSTQLPSKPIVPHPSHLWCSTPPTFKAQRAPKSPGWGREQVRTGDACSWHWLAGPQESHVLSLRAPMSPRSAMKDEDVNKKGRVGQRRGGHKLVSSGSSFTHRLFWFCLRVTEHFKSCPTWGA